MFFLLGMSQDGTALNPMGNNTLSNVVRISNAIFDHLNLVDTALPTDDINDSTIPAEWTNATLLNAMFSGNVNAGNISEIISSIDHFEIQRKAFGDADWITIQSIYPPVDGAINSFTLNDTTAKYGTMYTYQLVPVGKNGDAGYAISQDILSIFDGAYIADANNIYKVTNEYNRSNSQRVQRNALYEPFGSKYPFVGYNALTNYDTDTITAILLAPTSQSRTSDYIDRVAQTKLRNEFNSWLTNGRAKIFKDFNGELKLVTVVDAVPNSYYQELGNGIASTSFNYVEIGEFVQKDTDRAGITNQFKIHYKN